MAAYVSVPRDLTRVKSKVFFNLTKRQLICFGAAALIGVPSYFGIRRLGNTSLAAMCMILIMLPLFLLAMYEKDGQYLEAIAKQFIEYRFVRPRIRVYETDCYYSALIRQEKVYEDVGAIVNKEETAGGGKALRKPDASGKKANPGHH
ncbi:MAG: PrgI family protein [Clostridiales bacterium]|nr:PrgI family protein [Clostridiales bacterium]